MVAYKELCSRNQFVITITNGERILNPGGSTTGRANNNGIVILEH